MTLGMMVALQYIIGQLNAPLSQFIQFVQATQDAKISLERLSEIQEKEDEEPAGEERIRVIPDHADIEFRGVTFRYDGPHSAKALDDVSVTIPADKVTAIVGASGSGKTTMLKLMLGLLHADLGARCCSATAASGSTARRAGGGACGTVMQEGYVFSDTIAGNIGVSDDRPDMERVRRAHAHRQHRHLHRRAALGLQHQDRRRRTRTERRTETEASDRKGSLQGGQVPLLRRGDQLFGREQRTHDHGAARPALREQDGRVVVAHRLSTVRNADKIVVLNRGRIVEQGTHDELTAKRGYYYELVRNQLELGN